MAGVLNSAVRRSYFIAMELVDDPGTQAWLEAGEFGFEWDAGNSGKSERKHGVADATTEAGMNTARGFTCIFARRGNSVRPISCRPMRDEERKRYDQAN